MKHKFEFHRNERVMVYTKTSIDGESHWNFLPAVIINRKLKEPHQQRMIGGKLVGDPQYEGDVAELYDVLVFDERLPKKAQSCDFYGDRIYHMDEPLVPREILIEESL